MEQKHIITALSAVGLGVGVGLGLASGQTSSRWALPTHPSLSPGITAERVEQELMRLIVDMKGSSSVTFNEFPYYLRLAPNALLLLFDLLAFKRSINCT